MSRLAVGADDYPEAARKHIADARTLSEAQRHDGAAYHSGYVVECSLKAVLLHDRSYDPTTTTTDAAKLASWHAQLCSKKFGHKLARLLSATVGAEGARYLPPLGPSASVLNWTETMRYWAPGAISNVQAEAFLSWAELAVESIVQMTLDGVL